MTTKDLDQKLAMRRAFWAMGASTRPEVKLGALQRTERARADREEWTDIDVLAVHYAPLTGLTISIADCKTSRGRVAERLFWLRGVMDVVGADQGFLVREERLSGAARQLALRLGISAMGPEDRTVLLSEAGADGGSIDTLEFLGGEAMAQRAQLYQATPKSLERLMRYRETGYWLAPGHRNMTALPAVLVASRDALLPSQAWTLSLVADLAWLYLLACLRALVEIATFHLAEPSDGLAHVIIGDERERRDKEFLAEQLQRVFQALPKRSGPIPPVDVVPAYYSDLTDLMVRLLRRRSTAIGALRALEIASVQAVRPKDALVRPGGLPDPFAWKLASDVVRFLVRAGSLDRSLQERFDAFATPSEERSVSGIADTEAAINSADELSAVQDSDAGPGSGSTRAQISLFVDGTAQETPKESG